MLKSRSLILTIAVTAGLLGAMLVYLYVQRVETNTAAGAATRPVLVATRFLPAGSPGEAILEANAFEIRDVPARYVAPGAFSSPDELSGLILNDDVPGGEQLTATRFSDTETKVFFADFPRGTEALALPLDYIPGVAGRVQPGDKLDAFVTVANQRARRGQIDISGGINDEGFSATASFEDRFANGVSSNKVFDGQGGETFLLLREVQVMEVLVGDAAGGNPGSMILAVRPDQAAMLIHAQSTAKLWFTLVPPEAGSL